MNIQTVAENLRNTIAGKKAMLAGLRKDESAGYYVLSNMLEINIEELEKILKDVEQCAKQASDDSWITNPDRMGGAFTDEEINRASEWR